MKDNQKHALGISWRILILIIIAIIWFSVSFLSLESDKESIMIQQETSRDVFDKTQKTLRELKQLK